MAPTLVHRFSFGEGLRTASPQNFQHPVGTLSRSPNPFSVCPTSPTCAPYFGGSLSINLAQRVAWGGSAREEVIQVQWVGKLCFVVCVRGGRPPLLCFYGQLFHREGLGLEAGRSVWVEGRAVLAQDLWPPPTVSVAFISAICHPSVEFGGTETWLFP